MKSIWVKILKLKRSPLAQQMYEIKNRLDSSYTSHYKIDKSPIKSISVFGYIDEIDQNELVKENHLAHLLYAMDYVDLPDVEIRSISHLIFEYDNSKKSILIVTELGFEFVPDLEPDIGEYVDFENHVLLYEIMKS